MSPRNSSFSVRALLAFTTLKYLIELYTWWFCISRRISCSSWNVRLNTKLQSKSLDASCEFFAYGGKFKIFVFLNVLKFIFASSVQNWAFFVNVLATLLVYGMTETLWTV